MLSEFTGTLDFLLDFTEKAVIARKKQNVQNNDDTPKRPGDIYVGKLSEHRLFQKYPGLVSEPDYNIYGKPRFDPDLHGLKSPVLIHVKTCSPIEVNFSGGWLIAKPDPVTKIKKRDNNLLAFSHSFFNSSVEWLGWCWADEMHNEKEGYNYYGLTRKNDSGLRRRKYGIWPEDVFTTGKPLLKHRGISPILRPMDELEDVLTGKIPCLT